MISIGGYYGAGDEGIGNRRDGPAFEIGVEDRKIEVGFPRRFQRLVDARSLRVQVAMRDAPIDSTLIAIDADRDSLVHGDGKGLSPAHASHAAAVRAR